jgi:PadR family transcriptional regulator, regulatory protein PadR
MGETRSDILQGTLDLMVLKNVDLMGAQHGYGLALRIEQVSAGALRVNQGTIYLCLLRLVQKGWITAEWGRSESNRRAKYYMISRRGRTQLRAETDNWARITGVMARLLSPEGGR